MQKKSHARTTGDVHVVRAPRFLPSHHCALEDETGDGGYGGAIFAGYGSTMEFNRRTVWHDNEAASGGALYNLGEIALNSNGFIRGNKAVVRVRRST